MNKAVPPAKLVPSTLLLVFSHLRWDFVVQRPHHLLTRAARSHRVVYFEEPVRCAIPEAQLRLSRTPSGVTVATPQLPETCRDERAALAALVDRLAASGPYEDLITWYYTPMALAFSDHLRPDLCIYDCMDELAAFRNPPPGLLEREEQLFGRADIVFTGGRSLFDAKRHRHPSVFCFPSSIDADHFRRARGSLADPADQADIPAPRVGFFGVIDERMDLDLVRHAAAGLPEVQFVFLGPTAKIDPSELPRADNLHWLGSKTYDELPAYLGNWQAGWMPFALNEATRFISPTKTPEFLAAGLPLVSTAVTDVVKTYGQSGVVTIASQETILDAISGALGEPRSEWHADVDRILSEMSWDRTWSAMNSHMRRALLTQAGVRSALRSLTGAVTVRGEEAWDV
jgi:glycosyltransferase involved in cell wall biosynthesis